MKRTVFRNPWLLYLLVLPQVVVIGIENLVPRSGTQLPEWNIIMAAAMMALLPPVLVILVLQRWFVKGLVETEK